MKRKRVIPDQIKTFRQILQQIVREELPDANRRKEAAHYCEITESALEKMMYKGAGGLDAWLRLLDYCFQLTPVQLDQALRTMKKTLREQRQLTPDELLWGSIGEALTADRRYFGVKPFKHSRRSNDAMPTSLKKSARHEGRVYNLQNILKRLNSLYFAGTIKARIEWGQGRGQRAQRSREFGIYYYKERLIRIHPVLDQAWVPLQVVEAVVHHEMCHQVPARVIKGRRVIHTPEFKRREVEYRHFAKSELWMSTHLRRLMDPAPTLAVAPKVRSAEQLQLGW